VICWFHSGVRGVCYTDGYIELKDRTKDISISGGENISTVEVESVLYRHPAVLEAAVVARPDEKWGADLSHIWTREGWLYLAVIFDLFSRRVIGWSMRSEMSAALVIDAFGRGPSQAAARSHRAQ